MFLTFSLSLKCNVFLEGFQIRQSQVRSQKLGSFRTCFVLKHRASLHTAKIHIVVNFPVSKYILLVCCVKLSRFKRVMFKALKSCPIANYRILCALPVVIKFPHVLLCLLISDYQVKAEVTFPFDVCFLSLVQGNLSVSTL